MEKILLDELSNIISAYKEGKALQFYTSYGEFKDVSAEEFDIEKWYKKPKKFRIKPEPKYRPFKDAKECWAEMQKHQPVGFMKFKDTESGYYMLTSISRGVGVGINDSLFSYDRVFDDYTFADGLPFGVKVEE
jgi:hypothetical protein